MWLTVFVLVKTLDYSIQTNKKWHLQQQGQASSDRADTVLPVELHHLFVQLLLSPLYFCCSFRNSGWIRCISTIDFVLLTVSGAVNSITKTVRSVMAIM